MSETQLPSRRGRIPWVRLLLLVLAAAGVYAYVAVMMRKPPVTFDTMPVTRGDVTSHVTSTGTVQAVTQLEVGSQVSGLVTKLLVDYNSHIDKGQPLALLDPRTFQAQVDQCQAQVDSATANLHNQEANLANMAANVRSAQATVLGSQAAVETARATLANSKGSLAAARANVQKGEADLKNADIAYKREQVLKAKQLVATSDLDTARTTYLDNAANLNSLRAQVDSAQAAYRSALAGIASAQANVEANKMKLDAAIQQVKSAGEQIKSARAQINQAAANLKQAKITLSYTVIRAPITGIVVDRKVTLGQTVAAQFQAPDLFTLAQNLDDMQVWTSVDEADIGQVHEGSRAIFTVDSFPDDRFRGRVTQIRQAPVTVQGVVTYTVVISTKNPEGKLRPGMTATVNIHVNTRRDVVLIPNQALRFKPSEAVKPPAPTPGPGASPSPRHQHGEWGNHGSHGEGHGGRRRSQAGHDQSVWTVDPAHPGKLIEHRITPGVTDGTHTEMVKGDLKDGDQLVTDSSEETAKPISAPPRHGPRLF